MPYYLNVNIDGLLIGKSLGDGYSINVRWATAYPKNQGYKIAYLIYMSDRIAPDFPNRFFLMPPSFVSFDGSTNVDIIDLLPGVLYHFAVRAFEYDPAVVDLSSILIPVYNGLGVLPQSLLSADITATDTIIPLVSTDNFPLSGTVRLGREEIYYDAIDYINNTLIVPGGVSTIAVLVDQGMDQYYLPGPNNIGTGSINNLTLVDSSAPTETWTIKCLAILRDGYGNPIAGTERFSAIGSVSGSHIGGQEFMWVADDVIVSNGILSFSITDTTIFSPGDYFIVKVIGPTPLVGYGRGYNGTPATEHTIDGYDGYNYYDPYVIYWPIISANLDQNTRVFECWNRFDVEHFPFTILDGYRQTTSDILTTNLTYSDDVNTGFPAFDYAGYHRTDPVMLLRGDCIGSYIGGYQFCVDGYSGVGRQIRGINMQTANTQRQEVLLSTTGEPVCLVQRTWTGITCKCMLPYNEYPMARCTKCLGTGIVIAYQQFFDPRRSDGRIMVRFSPVVDDLSATDSGLESVMNPDCWTLCVPSIKDRDFIVRFDENNDEEYRYEILNVTRNKLFLDQTGVQKFAVQRIRKTDIIYQTRIFRNTEMFPDTVYTSISSSLGIPPHQHTIQVSEKIRTVSQINQITGMAAGHRHTVQHGVVLTEDLGHTHEIIVPPPFIP